FREDLYYRLNVIEVALPPLRQRPDDIIPLAEHILAQASGKTGSPHGVRLHPAAQRALLAYHWPGTAPEVGNVLERGLALCQGGEIQVEDLPNQVRPPRDGDFLAAALARRMSVAELEREYIRRVLADEGGNKTRAASRLGLDRKTLYRKLEEYARDEA